MIPEERSEKGHLIQQACHGNEEWCDSLDRGFTTLLAVAPEAVTFVHDCGRPSFLVWQRAERYCDECGRSFSSPFKPDLCNRHGGRTWADAWEETKEKMAGLLDG